MWIDGQRRFCLWRLHRQKIMLGLRMHDAGLGNDALRQQVSELDHSIQQAKADKQPIRQTARSRRALLVQLADSVPESSAGAVASEVEKLQLLQSRLAELEKTGRQHQESPSPGHNDWTRIGLGYGAIILFAALGFGWWLSGPSHDTVTENNESGVQFADAGDASSTNSSPDSDRLDRQDVPLVDKPVAERKNSAKGTSDHAVPGPPRALTALDEDDDLPDTGIFGMADDAIVALVTKPTSYEYLEAGFKEFRFGLSSATIQSLADENKVALREGRQNFFIEDGKLIGYERLYQDDNEGYLRQFREIFGGAMKDDTSESLATRRGSAYDMQRGPVSSVDRIETLLIRYYFPDSIAYLQATWRASAQANINSVFRREHLLFDIFDHSWVDARLSEHISDCRDCLEWVRQLVADENTGLLTLSDVLDYAGAKHVYEAPDDDASVETLKLLDEEGEVFIVVERALKDLDDCPKDSVSFGVHLGAMPAKTNPVYKYKFLAIEVDRCNSLVAQGVFPPRGTTIETLKQRDSHQKSFIWRTSDGWKVTVSPGSHIYLMNIPEKGL